MRRPTFKAYLENIQAKTAKTPDEFLKLAAKEGFVKNGQVVARHADKLRWFKSEKGLGHVHADDPGVSLSMKWTYSTGYQR